MKITVHCDSVESMEGNEDSKKATLSGTESKTELTTVVSDKDIEFFVVGQDYTLDIAPVS